MNGNYGLRLILLHFGVPTVGIALFVWLRFKMISEEIERLPVFSFFVIFAHYGAWLVLILTEIFWYWSGMASRGIVYL